MEKRNLRKERIGVVSSNKGDKSITVVVKWKEKHPIPYALWKHVL